MKSSGLTEAQWERLLSVLPPQKPHTGRPGKDHRIVLNGILWIFPLDLMHWQLVARLT